MAQKQLMLKEYLELDWTTEPNGPPLPADEASATVRCLLEEELRCGVDCGRRKLPQTRSMRSLTKISYAALSAVRLLVFATSESSGGGRRPRPEGISAARSLSMRFRGSFWRTRRKEEEKEEASMAAPPTSSEEEKAINQGDPFNFPSPVVSSRGSCSKTDSVSISVPSSASSSSSDVDISASTSAAAAGDVKEDDILSTPNSVGEDAGASGAVGRRREESPAPECQSSEEESEQLSPVSVMDFPSEAEDEEEEDEEEEEEEEEEGENSSSSIRASFDQSFAKLERTKLQLLQKIRRFECLADLDPVDLDRQFTSSDEDEEEEGDEESALTSQEKKAWGLLGELKAGGRRVDPHVGVEKLLLDFFVDGLSCSGGVERALLEVAREWVEGRRRGKLDDYEGEATLREMEREGGRWRFEAEEEVGVEVGGLLLGALVEELVAELVR